MVDTANVKNWGLGQYYDYLKENADHMDHELYDCMRSYYQSLGDYNNVKRWENAGKENKKLQKACEKFQKNHKKAAANMDMESLYVMKCLGEFCGEQAKHLSQLDKMEKSMYPIDEELRQAKYAGEIADAHKEYLSIHMHNEYDASMRKFFDGYENNAYKWNLEDYARYFKENRGMFSSKLFNNVQEQLRKVQEFQNKPINMETTKEMFQQRGELIKACMQYINERSGASTGKGQERLKVVKDLLEFYSEGLADKNLDQLRDVHTLKTYEGKTWGELDKVPVLTADRSQLGQTVGAQSSERFRVNTGEKNGFFTAREYVRNGAEYVESAVDKEENPEYRKAMKTVFAKETGKYVVEYFDTVVAMHEMHGDNKAMDALDDILKDSVNRNPEINALLENEEAKKRLIKHIVKGRQIALEDKGLELGDELSNRNVATTRVAELLGVGNLVARSEKMSVQSGNKTINGCFMSFAEGIDVRNGGPDSIKKLQGIKLDTPEFFKDTCNMDVLDFICAQQDRHGGNIFLKIDENTKRVIGIQGIDNDQSFTKEEEKAVKAENKDAKDKTENKDVKAKTEDNNLKHLHFISKDLASQILSIKKEDLEFATGDVLKSKDIDNTYKRITRLQKHIRENMIQLDDNDWDIKKLGKDGAEKDNAFLSKLKEMNPGYKGDLSKLKERYTEGVKELDNKFHDKLGTLGAVYMEVTKRAEIQPVEKRNAEPINYAEQEKPMDYAEQEKPMDYAEQEKPMDYAEQEKPMSYAEQEKPMSYAEQEKPMSYADQEIPMGYAEQEMPMKDIAAKPAAAPVRQTVSLNTLDQEDQKQKKQEKQEKMHQGLVADRRAFFERLTKNNADNNVKQNHVQKMNLKEFEGKGKALKPKQAKAEAPKKRTAEKAL